MVRRDGELDDCRRLVQRFKPAPLYPKALDGDQGFGTGKRILHQIARRVTDFIALLLRNDVQVMIRARLPQYLPRASRPASDSRAVHPPLRVRNTGSEAIGARR